MKILIAPAHYYINKHTGSEYTRSYEYIKALSADKTISGDAIVGYSEVSKMGNIKIHSLYSKKPTFVTNYHRFVLPFQVFIKSLNLIKNNKYDCLWHINPFAIDSTFSLLALWNRKNIRFIVGPIYTPFAHDKYPKMEKGIKTDFKRLATKIDDLIYRHLSGIFKWLSILTLQNTDKIIVIENAGKKLLEKDGLKNIEILPLGVIKNEFAMKPKIIRKEFFNLLSADFLVNRKRTVDLIDAIGILVNKYKKTNFKLTIVGDGYMKPVLVKHVNELGINDYINFVGRVSRTRIHTFYKKSDMLISASVLDSMPGVYFEAMSAALPMVLAKNESSIELKKNNFGGLVVKRCNPQELAAAIFKLINDMKLYTEFSKKNYQLINSTYDFNKNISRLKQILNG